MTELSTTNLTTIIDLLGTLAFAISGLRWASRKEFDLFGAYVIGFITAIGGGTTRDLLLGVTPFWMEDPKYAIVTGIALVAVLIFKRSIIKLDKTLFIFDTVGLGLFTVSGIDKALELGFPIWICIIMGAVSGSVGGVIRDIIINEVPLLFRKEVYALASVAGGIVYFVCYQFSGFHPYHEIVAVVTVILVRRLSKIFFSFTHT